MIEYSTCPKCLKDIRRDSIHLCPANKPINHRDPRYDGVQTEEAMRVSQAKANSGSNGNYYSVPITKPLNKDQPAYIAECNDIIEALGMNFAEGNGFKALWRKAAARQGNGKEDNSPLYDAQKVLWSGERLVAQET